MEAWSQRGSGWVVEAILGAYVNVARYQPFRGGSYIPLPKKLKESDHQCQKLRQTVQVKTKSGSRTTTSR